MRKKKIKKSKGINKKIEIIVKIEKINKKSYTIRKLRRCLIQLTNNREKEKKNQKKKKEKNFFFASNQWEVLFFSLFF